MVRLKLISASYWGTGSTGIVASWGRQPTSTTTDASRFTPGAAGAGAAAGFGAAGFGARAAPGGCFAPDAKDGASPDLDRRRFSAAAGAVCSPPNKSAASRADCRWPGDWPV